MVENLAWTLQVMALVIVGTGFLIGVVYDQVRVELGMLGVGAAVFLFARWLQNRSGG
jgi:cell shape-determining protein MreD